MNPAVERLIMKGMVTLMTAAPAAFSAFSEGGWVHWAFAIAAGVCALAFFVLAVITAVRTKA